MKLLATQAALAGALLACTPLATTASAQCATCPQPTVALSPVTQTAFAPVVQPAALQPTVAYSPVAVQQPVVLQTYRPVRPLFSGYWLRRLFGYRAPVAVAAPVAPVAPAPTFVTAAYQPTYPLTAGVLSPAVQTVARPIALAPTVTMSPVASCCPTSCCPTPGVTQAAYEAPACPTCAGGATYTSPAAPFAQPAPTPAGETPQPGLAPGANVPEQRLRPTPRDDQSYLDPYDVGPASPASPAGGSGTRDTFTPPTDADAYWQAPQLFDPNNRTTSRRPAAPVWNAVYQQTGGVSAVNGTVYRVGPDASQASYPAPRREQQGAGGWRSARD